MIKILNQSYRKGLSFGLTSGVITTLGLLVGLHAGTHSRLAVTGGIIVIAIADGASDALGMHISEESENDCSHKEVWQATIATFFAKLFFALTFVVPVLLLELDEAIWVSIFWGLFIMAWASYQIARNQKEKIWKPMSEHVGLAIAVIIVSHYVGKWVAVIFGEM